MALISPNQVQQTYGITSGQLARWRRAGTGPQYYRITARVIRYGTDDLDEWFTAQSTRTYTSSRWTSEHTHAQHDCQQVTS